MTKLVARMRWFGARRFWETLPNIIPDLKAHLPALTATIREEKNGSVLKALSSHPLPTTLSPETVHWRPPLIAAWTKQLKDERNDSDRNDSDSKEPIFLSDKYISALRGLARADGCGMPPGMTCPSVLATLLGEACDLLKQFRQKTTKITCVPSLLWLYKRQLECLAALSDWHPAPNVRTDPEILKAWGRFWLKLYQKGVGHIPRSHDATIILKGIAAKTLLKLLEASNTEETGPPVGMEPLLLESLTTAIDVAGKTPQNNYNLDWLSWQPQDSTRFPPDKLAKLPETLLKHVRLVCQEPDRWWDEKLLPPLSAALEELTKWNQTGAFATCRIDPISDIVTHVGDYLNNCMHRNIPIADSMNHKLYRWLIRDEIAAVKEIKKLLQKLENHWQSTCKSKHSDWYCQFIAWEWRMELQRTELATETPDVFHKNLLEALKKEQYGEVRMALSLRKLGKNAPNSAWKAWKYLWKKELKSDDEQIVRIAAVALLRPDPEDDTVDPVVRWQKLRDVIRILPKKIRPTLSMTELTHLMGNPSVENLNVTPHAGANQSCRGQPEVAIQVRGNKISCPHETCCHGIHARNRPDHPSLMSAEAERMNMYLHCKD